MPYADALQVLLVVLFLGFVLLKIAAQRRRGLRAVILRDLRERLLVGAFFGWFAAVLLHALGLAPALGRPLLFESEALTAAGMALGVLGVAVFGAALLQMGRSWHIGIDEEADDELVTTGVYALSRHPIYVFIDLFAWGVFLMNPSPFFGVTVICITIGVHLRMLEEEAYLLREHADAYEAYRARTRRYLGRRAGRA